MYTLLKQENRARRGRFETVHGTFETPCFMNVATSAAIKGGVSAVDLKEMKCQVADRVLIQVGKKGIDLIWSDRNIV